MLRSTHPSLKRLWPDPEVWTPTPQRFRQLQMDITRADEKKTWNSNSSSRTCPEGLKAVKDQDQEHACRRKPISRMLPRALQLDTGMYHPSHMACPSKSKKVRVRTPTAQPITLLNAARPRERNVFLQTNSVLSSQKPMPSRTLMQLRDNRREVAREALAPAFARISTRNSTRQSDINATQW